MVGRSKADDLKHEEATRMTDAWMHRAVDAYLAEQKKPKKDRKSSREICKIFRMLCVEQTGKNITLLHTRLIRLAEGGKTRREAMAERAWLTPEATNVVIDFIGEMAARGFPLSHRRLKEHIDMICSDRLGMAFPLGGVGKQYTHRFLTRYSDRIKMVTTKPLEDKRAQGANPTANASYWKLLEETVKKYDIRPETTFGVDEVGIQTRSDFNPRVFTSKKKKGVQHQQRAGTRENTTVLVTICADGTTIPPAIIFKGAGYKVSWAENNPLNASIGYQQKGWTDGEIGALWIKIFDKNTKHKVKPGEYRLLLVDGHNSHFTLEFLIYARENAIIIICYPSHTTHIYQGLDVVIFAIVKIYLGQERDFFYAKWRKPLEKDNFLEIYTKAHIKALTPSNVRAAFRATGVWPFKPQVVTSEMMAPSRESSSLGNLPVPVDDPETDALIELFHTLASITDQEREKEIAESGKEDVVSSQVEKTPNTQRQGAVLKAVNKIGNTNVAHLVKTSETTHLDTVPIMPSSQPLRQPSTTLSTFVPETDRERMLFAALRESEDQNVDMSKRNTALRTANLLNSAYNANTQAHFQAQDEKKKKKKQGSGLLNGNLARLITGDEFIEATKDRDRQKRQEEEEKRDRQDATEAYREAKSEWEEGEIERKAIKAQVDMEYKAAVAVWEAKKKRTTRGKFKDLKPKKGDIPRKEKMPLRRDFLGAAKDGDEDEEEDEEEEEGVAGEKEL